MGRDLQVLQISYTNVSQLISRPERVSKLTFRANEGILGCVCLYTN